MNHNNINNLQLDGQQQQLVVAHYDMAMRMAAPWLHLGMSADDVRADAAYGLCVAACRYNSHYHTTFATFAFTYIKSAIAWGIREYRNQHGLPRRSVEELMLPIVGMKIEEVDHHDADAEMRDRVEQALSTLTPNERLVMEALYGFNGMPLTVEQLAKRLNVSERYVYDITHNAMGKMKSAER